MAALVVVEAERDVVVELLQLEAIARLDAERDVAVGREVVAGAYVELVDDASAVAIFQIERIQDRIDAQVALVVGAEVRLDAVQQVVAQNVPEHVFGEVLFLLRLLLLRHAGQQLFFESALLLPIELLTEVAAEDGVFLCCERFGTDAAHGLANDGIALHALSVDEMQAVVDGCVHAIVAEIAGCDVASHELESAVHLTPHGQERGKSFVAHL